jgi:hypothetical protein
MKKLSLILTVALMAISITTFSGCATAGGPTVDQQTIADSAIILKGAARSASALAIQKDVKNKQYVQLAVTTLETFVVGTDYTPGALTQALSPMIKDLNKVEISLAVNTVLDLYNIYYGRYVKGKIAGNETAVLFLTALHDGAKEGIAISP